MYSLRQTYSVWRSLVIYAIAFSPLCGGATWAIAVPERPVVIPLPAKLEWRGSGLAVSNALQVSWKGVRSASLDEAVSRFAHRLERRTAIPVHIESNAGALMLLIDCKADDPAALSARAQESYTLEVGSDAIRLSAPGPTGVQYGLVTLLQLVQNHGSGFEFAAAYIDDHPRYSWRGLLIDVARHFVSVESLKRQIELMELTKLNELHLHLSDAEGFRLEIKSLPRLHEVGSHGQYYTQSEMRGIIAFAAARGVRIIPEFDMPAHTGSWLVAYPSFAAGEIGKLPQNGLAEEVMDPSNEALYRRLSGFFDEIARLFPDRYVHIGGDEVNGRQWTGSPRISGFKAKHGLADDRALQRYFTQRVRAMLAAHGKSTIVWDEMLAADPPKDVIIQSWRSSTMTGRAVRRGYQTLVSAGAYLDMLLPAESLYTVDPADVNSFGIDPPDWQTLKAQPDTDWVLDELRLDPAPPLTAGEAERIVGGEAAMWTESVTEEMLDMALWPRAAAYAERLWTLRDRIDPAGLPARLVAADRWLLVMGCQHYAAQARMVTRLAPSDPGALATLIEAVEPAKYYVRWHAIHDAKAPAQIFNELADAAFPESIESVRAAVLVDAVIASGAKNRAAADRLRAMLMRWRDNDRRVQALPEVREKLAVAAILSKDLADLAAGGLDALDMLEGDTSRVSVPSGKADVAIRRQLAWAEASATALAANSRAQPPGELFLALAKPIARLTAAAQLNGPGGSAPL